MDRLLAFVADGRLDASKPITLRELSLSGCVGTVRHGVKLLGYSHRGTVSTEMQDGVLVLRSDQPPVTAPLDVHVTAVSASARELIEEAGGTVTLHPDMGRVLLRRMVKPEKAQLKHYPDPVVLSEIREAAATA